MKSNIRRILDSHIRSLAAAMEAYRRGSSTRIMHDMRVDMKSIRSVFFLLEKAGQRKKAGRQHRKIKKIFADAGIIREWQLEARWLKKHRRLRLLRLMGYEEKIRLANRDFLVHTPGHIRSLESIREKGQGFLKDLTERDIRGYLARLLEDVTEALYAGLPPMEWHDLRKWVKRLLHAREWVPEERLPSPVVLRFFEDMDALQASIGHWHDLQLMENRLHEASAQIQAQANARHEALLARKKLLQERSASERDIRRMLRTLHRRWKTGVEN
jgi:CHAD domain-containing protein